MDWGICSLRKEDCTDAAELRFEADEWGLLPLLGKGFFAEILRATCDSKWGFGMVCVNTERRIAALIVASLDIQKYYYDIIMRRGPMLAFKGLIELMRNPKLVYTLYGYFNYSGNVPQHGIPAEWLTLVVRKQYRGRRLGQMMTQALIQEYRKRGVKRFRSTVNSANIVSCHLHDISGFHLLETVSILGQSLNVYKYDIEYDPDSIGP